MQMRFNTLSVQLQIDSQSILNAIHPADFDALHKMSIGPNIVEYTKIHGTT